MTQHFVTHLECSLTGEHYPANTVQELSAAGRPLLVRYDLDQVAAAVTPDDLRHRDANLWRYRELLPVRDTANIVSLGEITTPLIDCPQSAKRIGTASLTIKDEGRLPTGSFKARGIAMAVSMAKELGIRQIAMPTNGNAGAALAAYCTRAGIDSVVLCPEDTPEVNVREISFQGARTYLANGLINDCGKVVGEGKTITGWFDLSTLKEPYRIEGKKTMGLELAEQLGWTLPDVIMYPTGGGTGLIGMWKAFAELKAMGWLRGKLPRMVAVQAQGCAPIVRAFADGTRHAEPWQNATTLAAGIRVPAAVGDFLILDAVRESNGFAIAVSDTDISSWQAQVAQRDGLLLCPEGAATVAALAEARTTGLIDANESVVCFNCATGLKYPLPANHQHLDLDEKVDYQALAGQKTD